MEETTLLSDCGRNHFCTKFNPNHFFALFFHKNELVSLMERGTLEESKSSMLFPHRLLLLLQSFLKRARVGEQDFHYVGQIENALQAIFITRVLAFVVFTVFCFGYVYISTAIQHFPTPKSHFTSTHCTIGVLRIFLVAIRIFCGRIHRS